VRAFLHAAPPDGKEKGGVREDLHAEARALDAAVLDDLVHGAARGVD
jgi:hypothetical protein